MEPTEDLCLIDAHICSLKDVAINESLRTINLHCNYIERIENLHRAYALSELDLSSNRISSMDGLSSLSGLKTLNLSCNCIRHVSGLSGLISLVNLNLSYNEIVNVDGFRELSGPGWKLKCLKIHGNQLSSVEHVCECLRRCISLRSVILFADDSDNNNPLCARPNYREIVFSSLPHLAEIDGFDFTGQSVTSTDEFIETSAEFDGKKYAGLVLPDNKSTSIFITPRIDAALNNFRRNMSSDDSYVSEASAIDRTGSEDKLAMPEKQSKKSFSKSRKGTDLIHAKVSAVSRERGIFNELTRNVRDTDTASYQRAFNGNKMAKRSQNKDNSLVSSLGSDVADLDTESSFGANDQIVIGDNTKTKTRKQSELSSLMEMKKFDNLKSFYVQLMKDLDFERNCRLRAEEKSNSLTEQLQLVLQSRAADEGVKEAHKSVEHLKQDLIIAEGERQKAEIVNLKQKINGLQNDLEDREKNAKDLLQTVHGLKESIINTQQDHSLRENKLQQQVQESKLKAVALLRELELIKLESSQTKQQVAHLQAVLAERERALKNMTEEQHSLKSKEVEDLISKALAKAEMVKVPENCVPKDKYDSLVKKYSELEDEFRIALHIESDRFKNLQTAFEKHSFEAATNSAALEAACQQEKRSSATIAELTALVREQKGRLNELSRGKAEQMYEYRERIQQLEMHVNEARQRVNQMETLKKEKTQLQTALAMQESLVTGLREERKIWSEELAQQGYSLTQDRGRLESRIQCLQGELEIAKKRLDSDSDALRIKTKVIEDQTETIKRLKEGVVERDGQLKETRSELLRVQKELENQLNAEMSENQMLADRLEQEQSRKDQLKAQISDLQSELSDEKRSRVALEDQWRKKSDAISAIEKQVQDAKAAWEAKESRLSEERNDALHKLSTVEAKLRKVDDAFRNQLDTSETNHRLQIAEMTAIKQREIDAAAKRTREVEDEMRTLLKETDTYRRVMEERLKKLTSAFAELSQNV